jgi:hypothetical protein
MRTHVHIPLSDPPPPGSNTHQSYLAKEQLDDLATLTAPPFQSDLACSTPQHPPPTPINTPFTYSHSVPTSHMLPPPWTKQMQTYLAKEQLDDLVTLIAWF